MSEYKVWPVGQLPKKFQRPEFGMLKEAGYVWDDPRDVVKLFENKVAEFAGSKYAVSVDCCSHALFLALQTSKKDLLDWQFVKNLGVESSNDKHDWTRVDEWWDRHGNLGPKYADMAWIHNNPTLPTITIPKNTYVSVPMQITHAGFKYEFADIEWSGTYKLDPLGIVDGATRWTEGMYRGGMHCLSFQIKKRVPIGKGGMILTNSKREAEYLRKIRYDGRDLNSPYMDDDFEYLGWHYYMTPEDAARGILLMDEIPPINDDTGGWKNYSDLSKKVIFNG